MTVKKKLFEAGGGGGVAPLVSPLPWQKQWKMAFLLPS